MVVLVVIRHITEYHNAMHKQTTSMFPIAHNEKLCLALKGSERETWCNAIPRLTDFKPK